jgi:hypothetical protein
MLPPLPLHLCLLSPPWVYWDPGLPWKTHTMVPFNFLKLFPHLVCQAPWCKAALYQLLVTGGDKGDFRKTAAMPYTYPNSTPTRGGGKASKQTHA